MPKKTKKRDLDKVYKDEEESKTPSVKRQMTLPFGGSDDGKINKHYGKATLSKFEKNKARIYSWNVNGANAVIKRGDLQSFMSDFCPDVLLLQETKADLEKISREGLWKEIPEEYDQYWNCCKIKKGYSGVAAFTKVKPLSVTFDMGVPKHDSEGRVITLEFE